MGVSKIDRFLEQWEMRWIQSYRQNRGGIKRESPALRIVGRGVGDIADADTLSS